MKTSEMIISKYLRKEDVSDDLIVTMTTVALEEMPGDAAEQRWTLGFKELDKSLVLNVTTIRVLEKSFGAESDDWANKRVILYTDPNVSFKGQIVGGLRLRPLKAPPAAPAMRPKTVAPKPTQPPGQAVSAGQDFNDAIPQ